MKRLVLAITVAAIPVLTAQTTAPRGYYRFPAIAGDTIVFSAEGDLWVVGVQGGLARRLTSHPGNETSPVFAADQRTVAFSAQYEGPTEVYTMSLDGSRPVRRTFEGGATAVGYAPDGALVYATRARSTLPSTQLMRVDTVTGRQEPIPLAEAADATWDPSTGTMFFTRLPFQGSHTRGYKGGEVQQIWRLRQGASEAEPLTRDWDGTSKAPMWWQGRVYFITDRDGSMNIWSMDADGHDLRQHTHSRGWDIRGAALSNGRIVYQLGADLHLLTIASGDDHELPITLASDLDQTREKWITNPMDYLTSAHLSPDGNRVVLTARGQVFVATLGHGRLVEASRHPGVRYRSARFAPDNQNLYVLSDQTGETEFWRLAANGVGEPKQLTHGDSVIRFDGIMSPDGRWIAWDDKNQELWLYDTRADSSTRLAASDDGDFGDLTWSPDSKWLVFVQPSPSFGHLVLYSVATKQMTPITTERADSYSPAWSPDGKWLYFLSDRNFQSVVDGVWGPRAPEPFFDRQTKIYALALQDSLHFPFRVLDEVQREDSVRLAARHPSPPAPDTATVNRRARAAGRNVPPPPAPTPPDSGKPVRIALEGLASRLYEVPVPAGNYGNLSANGSRLFYVMREASVEGRLDLRAYDIKPDADAPSVIVDGIAGYELSSDGRKLLVQKDNALYVFDAGSGAVASLSAKTKVDLSGWAFSFDPREEWRQMFVEAWRLERDYFYDRGMHGNDWPAIRRKYEPLVGRVTTRLELADLLSQMVAELSALHTFVYGGDARTGPDQVQAASLGAVLTPDSGAGGWRIARLYRADPDFPSLLGPLARPDIAARVGDVIEQIDGVPTLSVADPAILLRNRAGRQVRLRLRPAAGGSARDVIVTAIASARAAGLRYDDWELSRREMVDSASDRQIGYVHLRAMTTNDVNQWERDFYPQYGRQGLIVDARHNNGGNIDSWVLERLMRHAWMYWQGRVGNPYWNMQWAFRGHAVVLVDAGTASDGEAFAEGFRRLGIGKVIGARTWGGEIWLTSSNVLVDRGIATAAEFGVYGPEGAWLIEGHGVDPDIVVDNLPAATYRGEDAQLAAGIAYLQQQIREHPVPIPPAPRHPTPGLGRP